MGSEMCIRDRIYPLPTPQLEAALARYPKAELVWAQEEPENQGCCCLLYTSDAADERSSVDLGGRRIIKKKNTTNRERREKS